MGLQLEVEHREKFLGKGISLTTNLEISSETVKGNFIYSKPNFAYTDNTLFTSLNATTKDFLTDYGYKVSETGFAFEQNSNNIKMFSLVQNYLLESII